MNQRLADALNPLLAIFGRKIIRTYIGHWSGNPLRRTTYPLGWRIAPRAEYEGIPEGATELDRFLAAHKEEIESRVQHR